jgi:hypothetical protein
VIVGTQDDGNDEKGVSSVVSLSDDQIEFIKNHELLSKMTVFDASHVPNLKKHLKDAELLETLSAFFD